MKETRKVDYIIVGQGLAGTLVSWFLLQKGKSCIVIDNDHFQAASNIAAGIINPITGRKYVKSWRIEQFLPFAKQTYAAMASHLNVKFAHEKDIYRGLYDIKDENTWEARKADPIAGQFIVDNPNTEEYEGRINGIFAYGVLRGGMQVQFPKIINAYRSWLLNEEMLVAEAFDYDQLEYRDETIYYKNIESKQIIFSEGYQAQFNPYFNYLPFEPAKGDVLIIKIEGRPFDNILRHKVFIAPIDEEHYWVGSDYRWKFEDDSPDPKKKEELIETLDKILNVPYEIVSHIAGIRPCVRGRRPFLGRHEQFNNMIIFNGLGTKGASLGPFWANHLVEFLEEEKSLDPEVDINRFRAK